MAATQGTLLPKNKAGKKIQVAVKPAGAGDVANWEAVDTVVELSEII